MVAETMSAISNDGSDDIHTGTTKQATGSKTVEVGSDGPPTNRRPITQILPTWALAILTAVSFALTVSYGFGNDGFIRISWIVTSPRMTILTMQALSQATGLLLMPLINGSFERLQWMLASRKMGISLAGFLALGSGTGMFGLLGLACRGRGGRLWAIFRFIFMIVAPIMSVILFADTETRLVFSNFEPFAVAGGIGQFNASYVDQWQTIVATIFANDYSRLLQDTKYAFPIASVTTTREKCSSADIFGGNQQCGSGYFLHGGLGRVTPWPTANDSLPDASIYQLIGTQGLQLDFRPLDRGAVIRSETDCIVVGSKMSALQICISKSEDGTINAKYLHCPLSYQTEETCLSDDTWQSSTGWAISMTPYKRRATVHFARYNMSAIALSYISAAVPITNIDPSELLSIYNGTFATRQSLLIVENIATYLTYSETSSTTWNEAGFNLRNLLAAPLYYFQPTYMSPYVMEQGDQPNSTLKDLPPEMYASACFANPSYRLLFAPWTIWTYVVVTGFLLVLSILVLILGSTVTLAGKTPETGLFPLVDFVANGIIRKAGIKIHEDSQGQKSSSNTATPSIFQTTSTEDSSMKANFVTVKNGGVKTMNGFRVFTR